MSLNLRFPDSPETVLKKGLVIGKDRTKYKRKLGIGVSRAEELVTRN